MAKKISQNKKKIDWKKVLTLAVIVVLIVLKLVYGNGDSEEDGTNQGSSTIGTESSLDASLPTAEGGVVVNTTPKPEVTSGPTAIPEPEIPDLSFRSEYLLNQHYEKHGIDMGFASAEEYEAAACMVVVNPDTLHKLEAEDGDDVYYLESTNEFVVVSKDGYIRTYFLPSAGIDYYNRQ